MPTNAPRPGREPDPRPTLDLPAAAGSAGQGGLGRLDQYRLLEKIGQGGMGAVYKALHVRLEKLVALKLLPARRMNDPEAVARFQREMRAVGRLDHPHIVRALDAREADGVHFLVMEYIEGTDLARLVKRCGPLPVADACELVRQTALGLHHAHEHGLIHRDVKPSNLILTPQGQVKVLDLGLARLHAGAPAGEALTAENQLMGTPDYMAPEQVLGAHAVDARADVYALGCTLYHLLAGQPPFAAAGYDYPARKMMAHLQDAVPPIRAQRPDVPAALVAVLERLLAREPAGRFASCAEVVAALQPLTAGCNPAGLLAGEQTPTTPERESPSRANTPSASRLVTPAQRAGRSPAAAQARTPRMSPPRAVVAVAVILVLAAGVAGAAWHLLGAVGRQHPAAAMVPGDSAATDPPADRPGTPHAGDSAGPARSSPPADGTGRRRPPDGERSPGATPPADRKPARGPAGAADQAALALAARTVLKAYCLRCHHGEGSEGGEFDALKAETLTALRDPDKPYVVPGQPAESFLFQRLALRKQGKGDMPPAKIRERPSDADKEAVRRWIEAGAPPFPTEAGRPHVGVKEVLTAVRDDLRQADPEDRPSRRYFTLNHLHDNPKVPDADLAVYRAALAKAINHLSWKPNIVVPRAVDKDATVFAVDVRKLDWDKDDLWREVLRAYPYGLRYGTARDANLQKLDDEVAQLTGCDLPYVRADWFVATATRPPLYHTLLRLPKNARDLERLLDVDVEADFRRDELARAGFAQSGVSGQNRLVERHAARYGAYWKSYDFKEDNRRGNLPRLPLGPAFAGNPFPDQAFQQDGGEIIFSLPNGLQGYFLVNGKDERLDAGPTEVVSDSERTSGTPAVITGISCMACHKHGMIAFKDQIRDGTAVAGEARRKVQRLYPPAPEMDEKLKEDGDRFLRALEKATGPFLQVGADKGRPIKEFAEPVGEIGRLYRLVDLDLTAAACELDVAKPDDLKALIAASKGLRELGLAPLLQEGGAVKRADWERVGATSLMQRAAREMERGTPFNITR